MGMPGSPETSENAVSEGHDRSQRTSIESPKAAQPSCLKGGFIRLFLKRTEQNTSQEDASSSNQSTEDKHGVRGKKRKVLGGNIFRLSCLRPAERTDNIEQTNAQVNKVDEQGNQVIPEEELKPYSKASFLRKIRGYRLMRERDATEKEKVVEMEQCKEGSVGEEHHEKKIEQCVKVTEPRRYKDILEEKGSEEKASQGNIHGGKSCDILEQDRKVKLSTDQGNSFREQENNDKNSKEPWKTVNEKDNCEMHVDVKKNNMEEHKKTADNVEEHDLQEQGNHAVRANGQKEEGIVGQQRHKETKEDLGNKVTKQDEQTGSISDPGNNMTNEEIKSQMVHELEKDLPEHNQLIHTKKTKVTANDLPENKSIMEKAEKLAINLQEQESSEENARDTTKSSPKQDTNEEGVRTKFSEQEKDGEALQVVVSQDSLAEISEDTQKKEDKIEQAVQKIPESNSQDKSLEASENSSHDKDSHKENEDRLPEQENHAENVGEPENQYHKQNIQSEMIEVINQFVGQDSHIQKEGKAVDQFVEEDCNTQKEGKSDHLLEQDSHIQKERKAGDRLIEQDSHISNEGKAKDRFLEGCSHIQKEGKSEDQVLEEDSHTQKEGKAGDQFLEEDCHKLKEGKEENQFLNDDNHLQNGEKAGDHSKEKQCNIQNAGDMKDYLLGQNSNIQNMKHGSLEQERPENNLGITKVQITEQDILADEDREGDLQEDNKCVKKHKGLGKVFSEEVKDRSVIQEISMTHTTCTANSEEPHTEFSTFQGQESVPNTVDFNYCHQEECQEDISDSDDDDEIEDTEWKSLQVEVKSMVQWLVDEASDRLTCFTHETQGSE